MAAYDVLKVANFLSGCLLNGQSFVFTDGLRVLRGISIVLAHVKREEGFLITEFKFQNVPFWAS